MSVRMKMVVEEIESHSEGGQVKMTPVISGSPENEMFFKWTPSGVLKIGTINRSALEQFSLGAEMYVDISPAD